MAKLPCWTRLCSIVLLLGLIIGSLAVAFPWKSSLPKGVGDDLRMFSASQIENIAYPWWDNSWQYRKQITLTTHPENYQIKIFLDNVDNLGGHLASTRWADIRFTENDNGPLLSYYIENYQIGTSGHDNATIWVRRPDNDVDERDNTIYVYYGNPSATDRENVLKVFEVPADIGFDSTTGWTKGGTGTVAINTLQSRENYSLSKKSSWSVADRGNGIGDFAVDYTINSTSTQSGAGCGVGWSDNAGTYFSKENNGVIAIFYTDSGNVQYAELKTRLNGTTYDNHIGFIYSGTTYYCRLTRVGNVFTFQGWTNSGRTGAASFVRTLTTALPTLRYGYSIQSYNDGVTQSGWVNTTLFRKYASREPTTTLGVEETYNSFTIIPFPGQPVLLFPSNGASITANTSITFTWTRGSNADNHRIEISTVSNFASTIDNQTISGPDDNTWTKTAGYSASTYYWRAVAHNSSGENFSSVWSFNVTTSQGPPIENFENISQGLISFRFDDFKDNIYNLTTEYLGKYGYPCSIYIQTNLVGTPGRLTWAQLDYLYTDYHFELGSHTRSHPHLASDNLSDAQLENEIYGSLTDIESNTSAKVYTFAPPYGDYDFNTLKIIKNYYYGMTTSSFEFNKYPWNFYNLVVEEVKADTELSTVENWIDEAISDNEYLILLFHNIEDNPENYSISPSTFISIVEYVHNHESQLRVISVRDAINLDLTYNVILNPNMDNKSDSWLLNWTRSDSNDAILDVGNHGTKPSENSSIRYIGDNDQCFLQSDNFTIDPTKKYYLFLSTEMKNLTQGWLSIKIEEFNSVGETISPGVWIRSIEKEGTYVANLTATYIPSSSQVVKGNVFIYQSVPSSFNAYLDRCILTTEDLTKSYSRFSKTFGIHIDGDIRFDNDHGANGGGTGTQLDPYIIENWAINASSAYGIWIDNTTKYFVIRNCLVENGGGYYYGIYLDNVINGRIENNESLHNKIGIYLVSSSYSKLIGNNCSNNSTEGISLDNSNHNFITLNHLLNNTENNAYDNGINYWDNGSAGNYWNDWQPPGHPSSNGVVLNEPRPIKGGTNKDNYPLVMPFPGQPVLLFPSNGASITANTSITFTWTRGSNADNHRIEISTVSNFASTVDNQTISGPDDNTWTKTAGYSTGTYYWRAVAHNFSGENISSVWSFNVTSPQGTLIENFEDILQWSVEDGTRAADTVNFKEGTQGLRLNSVNGVTVKSTKTVNLNLSTADNFVFWLYVYDASKLDYINIYFSSVTNWSKFKALQISGADFSAGWNKVLISTNEFTTTGGESWSNTMVRLRFRVKAITGENVSATYDDFRENYNTA